MSSKLVTVCLENGPRQHMYLPNPITRFCIDMKAVGRPRELFKYASDPDRFMDKLTDAKYTQQEAADIINYWRAIAGMPAGPFAAWLAPVIPTEEEVLEIRGRHQEFLQGLKVKPMGAPAKPKPQPQLQAKAKPPALAPKPFKAAAASAIQALIAKPHAPAKRPLPPSLAMRQRKPAPKKRKIAVLKPTRQKLNLALCKANLARKDREIATLKDKLKAREFVAHRAPGALPPRIGMIAQQWEEKIAAQRPPLPLPMQEARPLSEEEFKRIQKDMLTKQGSYAQHPKYDSPRMRCDKFVFVLGSGISAAAGIPTFRGFGHNDREDNPLVVQAQLAWLEHYAKDTPKFDKMEAPPSAPRDLFPRGVENWFVRFRSIESVLSQWTRENMPLVLTRVWRFWLSIIAHKKPTPFHMAVAELCRMGACGKVVSMNIDGLDFAAGMPKENIVPSHGCVFVGTVGDSFYPVKTPMDITPDIRTSVVMYDEDIIMSEQDDDQLRDQIEGGACLVMAGLSMESLPVWLRNIEVRNLVVINPNPTAVDKAMEFVDAVYRKIPVTAFRSTDDFMNHYMPGWKPGPITVYNDDPQAIKNAMNCFETNYELQ